MTLKAYRPGTGSGMLEEWSRTVPAVDWQSSVAVAPAGSTRPRGALQAEVDGETERVKNRSFCRIAVQAFVQTGFAGTAASFCHLEKQNTVKSSDVRLLRRPSGRSRPILWWIREPPTSAEEAHLPLTAFDGNKITRSHCALFMSGRSRFASCR